MQDQARLHAIDFLVDKPIHYNVLKQAMLDLKLIGPVQKIGKNIQFFS